MSSFLLHAFFFHCFFPHLSHEISKNKYILFSPYLLVHLICCDPGDICREYVKISKSISHLGLWLVLLLFQLLASH